MIKAIIFDFGNTLALSHKARQSIDFIGLGWKIFKENGFPGKKSDYLLARKKADITYSTQKSEKHRLGHYYACIAEEAEWKIPFRLCKKMDDKYYATYISKLNMDPDGVKLVRKLKKRNYFLGIISNGHRNNVIPVLQRYQLYHYFDTILISFNIKSQKSELMPFRKLLRKYSFKPHEVIMIGDRRDEDMYARKIGIHTIWIKRKKLYEDRAMQKPDFTIINLREVENIVARLNHA